MDLEEHTLNRFLYAVLKTPDTHKYSFIYFLLLSSARKFFFKLSVKTLTRSFFISRQHPISKYEKTAPSVNRNDRKECNIRFRQAWV